MAAVAALLDGRAALTALTRSLPRGAAPVLACRSAAGLERVLGSRLVDTLVVGRKATRGIDLGWLRAQYPGIPLVWYGVLRSDEAEYLVALVDRYQVDAVVVEGVDDPVAGEVVVRHSVTARRRAQLANAPRLLRLTEPLQRAAWDLLLATPGNPPTTATVARRLGVSREHLSRQFGAGGAPNLKRVIDLLQVVTGLDLLTNPGYTVPVVSRVLGYGTATHFRSVVKRIAGLRSVDYPRASVAEVVRRFAGGRGRSRRG